MIFKKDCDSLNLETIRPYLFNRLLDWYFWSNIVLKIEIDLTIYSLLQSWVKWNESTLRITGQEHRKNWKINKNSKNKSRLFMIKERICFARLVLMLLFQNTEHVASTWRPRAWVHEENLNKSTVNTSNISFTF